MICRLDLAIWTNYVSIQSGYLAIWTYYVAIRSGYLVICYSEAVFLRFVGSILRFGHTMLHFDRVISRFAKKLQAPASGYLIARRKLTSFLSKKKLPMYLSNTWVVLLSLHEILYQSIKFFFAHF